LEQQEESTSRIKSALELLAVVGPIVCLVDCIVIPLALLVLPLVGIHQIYHGLSDQLVAFIALVLCAPSLIPGFLKHRKKSVLAMMAIGFSSIFVANFFGHAIDQSMHIVMTVLGSLLLIKANADNRRFSNCCAHHKCDQVAVELDRRPGS
jgi:hypothetical protein